MREIFFTPIWHARISLPSSTLLRDEWPDEK
jgi:hypothetical protein